MTISYEKLCKGGYKRERGKTWTCPKCSNVNINQTINLRTGYKYDKITRIEDDYFLVEYKGNKIVMTYDQITNPKEN